jgi:hypothetical protein
MSVKTVLKIVIDPKNLLMTLINVCIFVAFQIAFIYTVFSKTMRDVIKDTEPIIFDFYSKNEKRRVEFCNSQQEKRDQNEERLRENQKRRDLNNAQNIETLKKYLLIPYSVVAGICVVCFLLSARRLNRLDSVVLLAIVLCFSTELFYYFVVFKNTQFYGKVELMSEYKNPGSTEEYYAFVPDMYTTTKKDGNFIQLCKKNKCFTPF